MPFIGIDLGTTSSCVGAVVDGTVQLFTNQQGTRRIPSLVSFGDAQRVVGDAAVKKLVENPENTVFEITRLIGRSITDKHLIQDYLQWPFQVMESNGVIVVKVLYKKEVHYFTSEELLAMLISTLKRTAEANLSGPVKKAVLVVPAQYDSFQRLATINAAKIAGLKVVRLVSAPIAAAIAYRAEMKIQSAKHVLIFNMGGGTCDVSLLLITKDTVEMKATVGDSHFGGAEFDAKLVQHFIDEFRKKYGKDIRADKKALQRLVLACRTAKSTLSVKSKAHISLNLLLDGINYSDQITREVFEKLAEDLFQKVSYLVERVIQAALLDQSDIDDIVLVGGSSWIPKIQQLLSLLFEGKQLNKTLSPEESVCLGASIYGDILEHNSHQSEENDLSYNSHLKVIEVYPHLLQVAMNGGQLTVLIPRYTSLPVRVNKKYTTTHDSQQTLILSLYAENDENLVEFTVTGIPTMRAGEPKIIAIYNVDENGLLTVKAYQELKGKNVSLMVTGNRACFNVADIIRLNKRVEELTVDDHVNEANALCRNSLRDYVLEKKHKLVSPSYENNLSDFNKSMLITLCDKTLKWIDNHGEVDDLRLKQKRAELDVLWDSFAVRNS
ncbi:hypothetical protein P879_03039 [Paragonimus westermani]|uniref:Heat shock 70kDa protein 1/2/6/8 n=1 Tax=Paragonimus westermani TaxID=34504 RepID=A0A8T0DR69_9TREM|nr:hypothetical protein P879_03039 [Paragonimus westermani]